VFRDEFRGHRPQALRLVSIKSGRANYPLQFFLRNLRVVSRPLAALEKILRDNVDALVGALRRKDGGDEQFERISKIQLTVRIGIDLLKTTCELTSPLGSSHSKI
jgi:hypothetical protein